jgi:hypothetical protein
MIVTACAAWRAESIVIRVAAITTSQNVKETEDNSARHHDAKMFIIAFLYKKYISYVLILQLFYNSH